jgi:hypothetical protein
MATLYPTIRVVDADGAPVTGDDGNLTLVVLTDGVAAAYAGAVTEPTTGEYKVAVTQSGTLQAVTGVSSTEGAIVIPARWYNAAVAGDEMDLVDAPNATAVTAIQSGLSTLTAQQVWEYGTRTLSSYGTLVADIVTAVWAAATRTLTQAIGATTITCGGTNIVDGDLEVEVPRGDSYSLVVTVTDDDDAAIDLSGYDEHTFSVKADAYRDDDDDTNVLFQATGSLSGDDNNVLTFAITPTQTELGTRDQWYDCDIECRNTEGTSVRTVIRGRYRTTYDVTRGS